MWRAQGAAARWTCLVLLVAGAVAVLAVPAGSAQRAARPDASLAGGGYTLVNPAGRNVEANRARFELAVRESQATGATRGKSLTIRAKGFDNQLYVARSNAVAVGGGANIDRCSLEIAPDGQLATLHGQAAVFRIVGATEVPTGQRFHFALMLADLAEPNGAGSDEVTIVTRDGVSLPFPLPDGVLTSGNVAMTEGPKAPSC